MEVKQKKLVCSVYAFELKKFIFEAAIYRDYKTIKDPETIENMLSKCILYYNVINL
jgi:hypothetical protein